MPARLPVRLFGGLLVMLLAAVPIAGSATIVMRGFQIDGEQYESPQFGYVVTWDERWAGLDRHVVSERDERDEMMLSNNDGRLWVIGYPADVDKSDALLTTMDRFTANASELVITGMDNAGALPYADVMADRDRITIEVQPVEGATVAIVLVARGEDFEGALQAAQEGVFLNDGAILVQEAVPAVPAGAEATEEPTEQPEATEEPTEEPEETEEPTEEPESTDEPTEEPEATEEATEEPTEEAVDSGEVWESEQFGVSLDLPAGWTVQDEGAADGTDTVVVANGVSTITVYATSEYDGELDECVSYARGLLADDPTYDSLRLQATADGQPYQGADDRRAYALFSYTGEDDVPMVLYIHCQPIEAGESVLILMQDVPQEQYQSQRKDRAAIINAIEIAD